MSNKKVQLNQTQKEEIKKALDDGVKPFILAKEYNVSTKIIKRIDKKESTSRKKYDISNRFKLTEQDKIDIKQCGTTNLNKVNKFIGNKVHNSTISRHFKEIGLNTYKALNKTNLKNYNKKQRISFEVALLIEKRTSLILSTNSFHCYFQIIQLIMKVFTSKILF